MIMLAELNGFPFARDGTHCLGFTVSSLSLCCITCGSVCENRAHSGDYRLDDQITFKLLHYISFCALAKRSSQLKIK